MAQITGYICDVCEAFALKRDDWLKIVPYAEKGDGGIDVCSNRCMCALAEQRAEAKGEPLKAKRPKATGRTRKIYTDDFKLEVLEALETKPAKEVAEHYGIPVTTLWRWKG